MRVLALNSGSSSLKLAVYEASERGEELVLDGQVAPLGDAARIELSDATGGAVLDERVHAPDGRAAARIALDALRDRGGEVRAIGHRVVHGGPRHSAPARVDAALIEQLRAIVPLAPLHLPAAIGVIAEASERAPSLPQVACFDTAFHRRMPELSQRYPLPPDLWDAGVRKYGFHGLSYEYVVDALGDDADGRIVIAHLGSGASLAAIRDGEPVDTTMGLTPTGGIVMGTRTGDLDPGVVLYLLRDGRTADEVEDLVNNGAGLRGVSGSTSDMRTLLEARADDPAAALAVEMFCTRARAAIGSLTATLGGLDTLVFTGGIGERAAAIRAEISAGLDHLGVRLDAPANEASLTLISAPDARVRVLVVQTHEERMIARHTARLASAPA